jgi:hypothetical protein
LRRLADLAIQALPALESHEGGGGSDFCLFQASFERLEIVRSRFSIQAASDDTPGDGPLFLG